MPPPSCPLPLGFHGMPFNLDLCKSICFKLFRILLYGVIRTIRPLGPLDGLLGGRFIVTFLSVLCIIVAKGVLIAIVVDLYTVSAASGRLRTTLSGATVIIGRTTALKSPAPEAPGSSSSTQEKLSENNRGSIAWDLTRHWAIGPANYCC